MKKKRFVVYLDQKEEAFLAHEQVTRKLSASAVLRRALARARAEDEFNRRDYS